MDDHTKGNLPGPLRLLARPARLLPLGPMLTHGVRRLARRRPELFERLGSHRTARFLIEPTDLDYGFLMVPDAEAAVVTLTKKGRPPESDVRVRGPLLTLLGLLDGTFDGDALFFNRAISVGGRTDALVALRNAIEDAELTPSVLIGLSGEPARIVDTAVRETLAAARRLAGAPNHEDA
jgi:predicted lipid carrier protein YhbT